MECLDEILSFMDLLDLDEEVIDSRLKPIMDKSNFTNKQLDIAIYLLKYKHLINLKEGSDCENDGECNFVAKLINNADANNIENVCKITNIVLCLDKSKMLSKSEHLLQQILSSVDLPLGHTKEMSQDNEETSLRTLLSLKICDSILDAAINNKQKISLLFLHTPLENILSSCNQKLRVHFLTSTVPKMLECVIGYSILDKIWLYLNTTTSDIVNALKVLSCLSEFYLCVPESTINDRCAIVFLSEFWNILLLGLLSNETSVRKISVYLLKRAIDCVAAFKTNICLDIQDTRLLTWKFEDEKNLKQTWNSFFILMDSLEEKQSNIVLPSLQLFDNLKCIEYCWLYCAYKIGLKHENMQVRLKCLEYRLMTQLYGNEEAVLLLETLNDVNLYENSQEYVKLKGLMLTALRNCQTFKFILKAIPSVKWSPIPVYHFSAILADVAVENIDEVYRLPEKELIQDIINILKVPCNNIAIRGAVRINMSHFIPRVCRQIDWIDITNINSFLKLEALSIEAQDGNPFIMLIKDNSNLFNSKIDTVCQFITDSHKITDFGLFCLEFHPKIHREVGEYLRGGVCEKYRILCDTLTGMSSDNMQCMNNLIIFVNLLQRSAKTYYKHNYEMYNSYVDKKIPFFLQCLIKDSNISFTIDEVNLLFERLNYIPTLVNDTEVMNYFDLLSSAVQILKDKNAELKNKVLAVYVVHYYWNSLSSFFSYEDQKQNVKETLQILNAIEFKDIQNMESSGRLRNGFYEKSCELLDFFIYQQALTSEDLHELTNFIENVIECGGYGCLKWILRIINRIIRKHLIENEKIDFNIVQFINRMWKEIEELKSNNQYNPCMEEFVKLITQESLLVNSMYCETITFYCNEIIKYGPVKNTPLFYLTRDLNDISLTKCLCQAVETLCEILLYSPVLRKDQRITENLVTEILQDPKYGLDKDDIDTHFDFEIQYIAVSNLHRVVLPEMYDTIATFIMNRIDDTFRNKQRYHGNSQRHRLLLIGLQHLLNLALQNLNDLVTEEIVSWSMDLLGKLPHQPSVRTCLEWYLALNIYVKKTTLKKETVDQLKSKNVPITSQFVILYWVLKHKILNETHSNEEYEFVMDFLLSYTMGQVFNIRLHAQYLATKLYQINKRHSENYTYIVKTIENTFVESSKDKNFVRLKKDFFINDFDLVSHLTPSFIYYFLPRYFVFCHENVDKKFIRSILDDVNSKLRGQHLICSSDFKKEWLMNRKSDDEIFNYDLDGISEHRKDVEKVDSLGTIQKKYIPWKNMSDIDVYEVSKKKVSSSELIVVASLIDKLPNLGGMARTSEVFGVKTYVIDSIRHLQDIQFQGLSVSAERWVNIQEVRPGAALKGYLMGKKAEGYAVVAAEQTSTSCQLQSFKFPKKTLLLLGHEKEGIPCDLLPLMDHCVEIPQQGYVRSLNVHVTAAIFIWEYNRQISL